MRVYYFLLLYVCTVTLTSSDKETEEELKRKSIIEKLTRTHTVLLDDYHLVTRQIATNIFMYRSYRTVSVIFFPIMRDVTDARFTFQSEELHLNNIGSCDYQDVVIKIKHGSYPAVNPDGYNFPTKFIDSGAREPIHTLEIKSDGLNRTYAIENPKPGNWYALAYIKWEDPRDQAVEQQGLVADCQTILYTDLQVKRDETIEAIDCSSEVSIDYSDIPVILKCISTGSIDPITFNVTITNAPATAENIQLDIAALAIPTEENRLISCIFNPTLTNISNKQSVVFSPHPNSWHYLHFDILTGNASNFANCESYTYRSELENIDNNTVTNLMRDDKGRFFTFDYGLPTTDLHDVTSLINITSSEITTVRFTINHFLDIGGSLIIEASLLMVLKYYMGYKRELKKGALLAFSQDNPFIKVVFCTEIGYASIPLHTGHCQYNDKVKPALFVLNSTDSESIYDKVIIPFPESGTWFLTIRLFCDGVVCPCPTSHNGTKYYVNSDASDAEGEDLSGEISTNTTKEGETNCNATVVLSISSNACVSGRCSNHGTCLLNTFGGLVMSFCQCSSGYGGWDCSDESRMDSRVLMLASILMLTLSNLIFFFSIYVAVIRLYYPEAMMYAFTMIFSTFYHACDAPMQVAFCILRGNILQFGDFYCGIMSFWVTLLAMSIIGERLRSSLHLIGAIGIAILTTWNMHSFYSFLFPVALAVFILLVSWYMDYKKTKKFLYPRSYYRIYLPIGMVTVSIGLICYGFLQTEKNYKVVHSVWHMIVALSVVFMLPDVKRREGINPFVPSPEYCRLPFAKVRRKGVLQNSHATAEVTPVPAVLSESGAGGILNNKQS